MYRNALIDYMNQRARKLQENDVDPKLYFTTKDQIHIEFFRKKTAKRVWISIGYFLAEVQESGTSIYLCPFCHAANFTCSICKYKESHKECSKKGSDIVKIHVDLLKKNKSLKEIFDHTWLKKIYINISKKYKIPYSKKYLIEEFYKITNRKY